MTEEICQNGHVMQNGFDLCPRCNAPSATAVAAVEAPAKKKRKAAAKPKSKSEAKRVKIQKASK